MINWLAWIERERLRERILAEDAAAGGVPAPRVGPFCTFGDVIRIFEEAARRGTRRR